MSAAEPQVVPIGLVQSPAEMAAAAAHAGPGSSGGGTTGQQYEKKVLTWQDFYGRDLTTVVEYEPRCGQLRSGGGGQRRGRRLAGRRVPASGSAAGA